MNTARIVDQVRTSRSNRQQAAEALAGAERAADDSERSRLVLAAVKLQNEAIAVLEQALLATVEI